MPNPYTGTLNDPISEAQHGYLGKDWEKLFKLIGGGKVYASAQGPGAPVSLGGAGRTDRGRGSVALPSEGQRIGDEDVFRTNQINAYLGQLTDEKRMQAQEDRDLAAHNQAVDAQSAGRQAAERGLAIANDPGTSQSGAPILGGAGMYTAGQGAPAVNRQAIAAQMAPGQIAPPAPAPPVTFGAPVKATVSGKNVFVRPGSDGLTYDMARRPVDPSTITTPETAADAAARPVAQPVDAQGQPLMGDALLKTLTPSKQTLLTRIIEGQQAIPTGAALKDPYWKEIIETAGLVDPSFDTVNYNARNKAYSDLSSPSGTGGKSINALNTASQHISKLSDLVETLDNFDIPMLNRVRNPVEREFGSTKVTNFDAVQPQAMKEIERLWRGAGGSAGEIDKLKESLSPNMGKQQQREALAEFADLMLGKLDATRSQRDSALGPIASKRVPVLFDQNKATLSKIFKRAGKAVPDILSAESGGGGEVSIKDPNGVEHKFATQAQADAFKNSWPK